MKNDKDIKMVLIFEGKYIYEAEIEKWNELCKTNPIKKEVAKLYMPVPSEFSCKVKRVLQENEISQLDLGEKITLEREIKKLRRENWTLHEWLWDDRKLDYKKGYQDAINDIKQYAFENYLDCDELNRFLKNFEEELQEFIKKKNAE